MAGTSRVLIRDCRPTTLRPATTSPCAFVDFEDPGDLREQSLKDTEVAAGDALDGGDGLVRRDEGGGVRMDDGGR